jgi:hypothetical protein
MKAIDIIKADCDKAVRVIESCKTYEHYDAAVQYVSLLMDKVSRLRHECGYGDDTGKIQDKMISNVYSVLRKSMYAHWNN